MGKQRAKHPFEDDFFIDGFLGWMDPHEGQHSIEALDLVFDALEHAGVDAKRRKIVWDDGKRLSIEQSVERIHAAHPDVPRDQIESHLCGWLESCAPNSYSERQLEELDRTSPGRGSRTTSASQRPLASSRELRTLQLISVGAVNACYPEYLWSNNCSKVSLLPKLKHRNGS